LEIVQQAKKQGLNSISFTYTEPTVYYEYLYDISIVAKQTGMKTSIVSNGYINREPLLKLLKVLDAVKIDLKGFSEKL
jgi:pyruvate formate lyase activating enzyme